MDDKKVFDVAPPPVKPAEPSSPRKIMLTDPADDRAGATSAPEVGTEPKVTLATKAKTIQPLTTGLTSEASDEDTKDTPTIADIEKAGKKDSVLPPEEPAPDTDQEPEKQQPEESQSPDDAPTKEDSNEPQETDNSEPETEEPKLTPIKDTPGAVDELPDTSQRATSAANEAMQDPKIYDTKAYFVPINAKHSHGHVVGALIAGLLAAAAVVGGVYVYATKLI